MESFDGPRLSGVLIGAAKLLLPALLLIRHGRTDFNIVGDGLQRFHALRGQRAIICPNHSSWDDADMIFAFSSLVRENFNYLTAWEVLHHHFGYRTWLQHIGCYSIIRGYPDRASYKATRNLLVAGKNKVVIFPEGEISHDSHNLLPLKPGMVQIAFSALQKMEKENNHSSIFLLPVGLKYKFRCDAMPALQRAMAELESSLKISGQDQLPIHKRINLVSQAIVSRLEEEYGIGSGHDLFFDQRIDRLRTAILEHVARQLNVDLPPGNSQLELAHILQARLYQLTYGNRRIKPEKVVDMLLKQREVKDLSRLRRLARDLHRVVDFISIYEDFVGQHSSAERLAEVIDLLEAEVLQIRSHKGGKRVFIHVGEPIDLSAYLAQYKANKIETEDLILTLYKEQMNKMIGVQ